MICVEGHKKAITVVHLGCDKAMEGWKWYGGEEGAETIYVT